MDKKCIFAPVWGRKPFLKAIVDDFFLIFRFPSHSWQLHDSWSSSDCGKSVRLSVRRVRRGHPRGDERRAPDHAKSRGDGKDRKGQTPSKSLRSHATTRFWPQQIQRFGMHRWRTRGARRMRTNLIMILIQTLFHNYHYLLIINKNKDYAALI